MNQYDSDESDAELLAQAAKGDRKSFGAFYERYLGELYRYINYKVGDHDEAEDLTEVVFLKAWETIARERHKKNIRNIRAWIYRIAHNAVIDYYRVRKQTASIEDAPDKKLQSTWLESEMDDAIISQKLAEGVKQLSAKDQQIIILRFINQLSHADVAKILEINEGHVRVLQYRALQRLREIMSEMSP